ncbi:MAG TPA: hypothetical protein VM260_25080, partial [Pirellula sp.]|nr:hypothetical protein [Pirellula sp.]
MNTFQTVKTCVLLLVLTSPDIWEVEAETIVVPNVNENSSAAGPGLTVPFSEPGVRWQQIYVSSEFNPIVGDIIEISQVRFRIDEARPVGSTFSTTVPGLNIFVSTTTRNFDTASSVFSQNVDHPLFEVLPATDVAVSGSRSSATSFDVVIPLPNRYQYDRRIGNLVLDIRVPEGSGLPFLDQIATPGSSFTVYGSLGSTIGT